MKSKIKIVKWILKNCRDKEGNIDLSDLDFSCFSRTINIEGIKTIGDIKQGRHKTCGYIDQSDHTTERNITQSTHRTKGTVVQWGQRANAVFEYEHEINIDLAPEVMELVNKSLINEIKVLIPNFVWTKHKDYDIKEGEKSLFGTILRSPEINLRSSETKNKLEGILNTLKRYSIIMNNHTSEKTKGKKNAKSNRTTK